MVEQLRAGNGVSVAPLHAELTIVEAADILGVSRKHLVKLLEQAAMPYRMVGSHRRIRLVDVLAYRDRQAAQSRHALDQLTAQAEELGLYDASVTYRQPGQPHRVARDVGPHGRLGLYHRRR